MASLRAGSVFNYDDHATGTFVSGGTESGWDAYSGYSYSELDSFAINGSYVTASEEAVAVVEDTRVFPRVPRERVLP